MGGKQPNPARRGGFSPMRNPVSKEDQVIAGKAPIPAKFIAPDLFAVRMAPFAWS
jgi:hypothetical protein